MIFDKDGKVPAIEEALKLVARDANTFEDWKTKGLGLRLAILGLAGAQTQRMSKLAGMVVNIEDKLLNKEVINELEPKHLFQLYQLATKSLSESYEFVERSLKNANWSEIETELLQVKAQGMSGDGQSGFDAQTAQELLTMFAKAQAKGGTDEAKVNES